MDYQPRKKKHYRLSQSESVLLATQASLAACSRACLAGRQGAKKDCLNIPELGFGKSLYFNRPI